LGPASRLVVCAGGIPLVAVVLYDCWSGQLPRGPARSVALVGASCADAVLTMSGQAVPSLREEPAPGGLVVEHGHELEARPFDVDVVLPRLSPMPHRLQLLYFPDCPHWRLAEQRLGEVAARFGLSIEHQLVMTEEEAERVSFRGSPTILIDGVDPFAEGDQAIGLSCRIYLTPDGYAGSPTLEQIAAVLDRE
jgi:hypothetical protein